MITPREEEAYKVLGLASGEGPARSAWRMLRGFFRFLGNKPLGAFGLAVLAVLVIAAVLAPVIAPFDVKETHAFSRLQAPDSTYLMGTDKFGRDVFSRVLFGTRTSLFIATMASLLGIGAGILIGLVTGYWGGRMIDHVLQRLIDIQMSIPGIVLTIAIITGVGRGVWTLVFVISIVLIPTTSRVIRGAALSEGGRQYVEAARAIGCSDFRVMYRHILPNLFGPIIVLGTAALGNTLLIEGGLSFLGYGPPPPTPTLGGMLSGDNRDVFRSAVWLAVFPGAVLALAVYSFNVLGDAVRDKFDPRMRGSQ